MNGQALAGVGVSLLIHGMAAIALSGMLRPQSVPQQDSPRSMFTLETREVPHARATPERPETTAAQGMGVAGAREQPLSVPLSRAATMPSTQGAISAVEAAAAMVPPDKARGDRIDAATPMAPGAAPVTEGHVSLASTMPPAPTLSPATPAQAAAVVSLNGRAEPVVPITMTKTSLAASAAEPVRLSGMTALSDTVPARTLPGRVSVGQETRAEPAVRVLPKVNAAVPTEGPKRIAPAAPPPTELARSSTPRPDRIDPAAIIGTRAGAAVPQVQALPGAPPSAVAVTAMFGWDGAGQVDLDAKGLATVAAFMAPGDMAGGATDLRDRMAEAMAGPDCARVQTAFDPVTGTLELRGHVSAPSDRAALLAALRAQVGDALILRDATHVLPRPQCGILDGLSRLGLPQSEEQLRDPLLVGENAQVRSYDFSDGERLILDLTAPDYPAYVYVDYYDGAGQVIHLVPSDLTPLTLHGPATTFSVGRTGAAFRVAPPFGQDIAVALAVDTPLYDGTRPLLEEADTYLDFLRVRLAALQDRGDRVRGEWVYLFVSTHP